MNIKQCILRLTQLYNRLTADTAAFLDGPFKNEAFVSLIEQRELTLEDIDAAAIEASNMLSGQFADYEGQDKSAAGVLNAIKRLLPEYEAEVSKAVYALKELIEVNKLVEEPIQKALASSKQELAKIRKGKAGIKGYRQGNLSESRFINKIK